MFKKSIITQDIKTTQNIDKQLEDIAFSNRKNMKLLVDICEEMCETDDVENIDDIEENSKKIKDTAKIIKNNIQKMMKNNEK